MQVRDDAVEQHEEREYDGDHHPEARAARRLEDRCRDRQRLRQQTQQHASGDGKHKAAHDGQQKAGRHRERQQNIEHRAAVHLDAVDAVYRAHDRTHCPRQKIQRQQRPDEQRTERRRRRDLLKVRQDELLQAFRHQLEHRPEILDRNAEPRDERIDKHQKREQGKQQKIRQGRRRLRNTVRKKAEYHAPHQIDQPILSVQAGSPFPLMFYLLYQLLHGFTTVRTKTFFVHLFAFTLVFSLPLVYT